MQTHHAILIAAAAALAACSRGPARSDALSAPVARETPPNAATATTAALAEHERQQTIQWGPAPSVFPPGAEIAVMAGDPSKSAPFTVRLRFPNGYRIPPHTHPTAENITVLAGTFLAGAGSRFIESAMQEYGRDGFASIPANHPHFAMARGLTVVQVHAMGPFALTYVDAADTPAQP